MPRDPDGTRKHRPRWIPERIDEREAEALRRRDYNRDLFPWEDPLPLYGPLPGQED